MAVPKDEVTRADSELKQAVRRIDSDLPPAMERLKQTARSSVEEAAQLARQARRSSGMVAAVRPPRVDPRVEPGTSPVAAEKIALPTHEPESITQKYNALKNF